MIGWAATLEERTMDTVATLRQYNRWRRGQEDWPDDERGPNPKEIGETIDRACDELERLTQAGREAANMLHHEAAILRDFHTISGQWDNDDREAKASYDAMLALAARLTPNAELRGAKPIGEESRSNDVLDGGN